MELSFIRLSTIVFAIFFGVSLSVLARHLRFPAIAPLLIGGILLGPEVSGLIDSESLGEGLRLIIALSVATILFEGGLTLDPGGFKKASGTITRLLTIGVLVTWIGSALAVHFIFDYSVTLSLLAGSLIIVTGPTVINPLLQRIKVNEKLHHILHWEGVLIDPIGVFIAILCFEWISIEDTALQHFIQFSMRLLIGLAFGAAGGYGIYWLLKRKWIPEEQVNIFVFAAALLLFALSDLFMHEAGILTVVIAGLILGWKKPTDLKNIRHFKSELTEMAIAVLFILLAAKLKLSAFISLGIPGILLIAIVIIVIRPVGIFLSTYKSNLKFNERSFLAWLAPRGVVAGSMASLFTLELNNKGFENAFFLEAFTFSIIGATILIQGSLSSQVARMLKVKAPPKKGWLIVGANFFARRVAEFINQRNSEPCLLIDNNKDIISEAQSEGLTAILGDALAVNTLPETYVTRIGNVIALTDNRDLNELVCEKWSEFVDKNQLYRWTPSDAETPENVRSIGKPIWCDLPKPTQVGYDLNGKESLLSPRKTDRLNRKLLPGVFTLMSYQNNELALEDFTEKSPGEVLLYKQLGYHLPLIIRKEHTFTNLQVKSIGNLLTHVFEIVFKDHSQLTPKEALQHFTTEHADPFFILGNEVAVPHAHFDNLTDAVCIIAQVPQGLKLEKESPEISRLFFILLNPASTPELHLMLLADIARIASDTELVQKLIDAPKPSLIVDLLRDVPSSISA